METADRNNYKQSESAIRPKVSDAGKRLVKGAAIMSVAGVLSKVLGAFFRIPLTNWIGAKGMSYYSAAYSVYSFFLFIAVAGLPVAISRMVSSRCAKGDYRNAHRVYRISLVLMLSLGLISASILLFGSSFISAAIGNPGSKFSMMALSPVLLCAPIVSSFRGYSQGKQNMMPTALSEIIEQLFRVIVGLSLAYFFMQKSLEKAAAGATFGASAGSLAALILLLVIYTLNKNRRDELICASDHSLERRSVLMRDMLSIAIPITIGSSILPIMSMIDASMIMPRLMATGWVHSDSKVLYGLIGGFCSPIIEFPQVFTIAIATSMVPAVTAAHTRNNKKDLDSNIRIGLKTLMLVSFPCMVGLMVMAKPILHLLYPFRAHEADMAVPTLQILAFGIVIFSTLRAFSSALQGIGHPGIPVRNLAVGAIVKVIMTYILVGIPTINIRGAAIANIAAYTIAAVLNYKSLKKHTRTRLNFRNIWIMPLIASAVMGIATAILYKWLMIITSNNSLSTGISVIFAVAVYFVVSFKIGCIGINEALLLPGGDKMLKLAELMHIIKREKH